MLDVKRIVENLISNYDFYTRKLLGTFESRNAYFTCPLSITECINLRQCYACSFHFEITVNHKAKFKTLPCSFPIMIGSKLDMAFREAADVAVSCQNFDRFDNILIRERSDDHLANIAITCFVVNGIVKQIPFYLTNDVSNFHVINNSIVRLYTYTLEEKGTELCFYLDKVNDKYDQGNLVLRLTSGEEKVLPTPQELSHFFKCPHDVTFRATKALCQHIYKSDFEIDHLSNKVTFTPGYIFFRLFVKTLRSAIETSNWSTIQRLHKKIVHKSILNGDFSHIISKKTIFYKELQSNNKILPSSSGAGEQLYEMGSNNKIFIEKKTTCYREINLQNYQLIPFLSQTVYFQISEKAKMKNILSFKDSYVGFLCLLGTSEARNVCRQMMFTRDVNVSTQDDTSKVYAFLNLRPCPGHYYVVVNNACLPVTKSDFYAIDLLDLKLEFQTIECFRSSDNAFLFVNYKPGMLYKRLSNGIWVTPRDFGFWSSGDSSIDLTFDFLTSHLTSMIPFWNHNSFPKNVLALNTLKNSVLSRTDKYCRYFKETMSAYNCSKGEYHEMVIPPVDAFSEPWVTYMPKIPIMFASFQGITQDDCIAMIGELDSFDIVKMFTLKIKLLNAGSKYFHSASGPYPGGKLSFLGTLVCRESPLDVLPQSTNVILKPLNPHASQIFFSKPDFRVRHVDIFQHTYLFIYVESEAPCNDGDKLCSLAGQKGVVRRSSVGPRAYDANGVEHSPRLLINPESLIKRQTLGQIKEMMQTGTDCPYIVNSHGNPVRGRALVGKAFYFIVHYKSCDHIYLANQCVRDKLSLQPLRGRSRLGGMKLGCLELINSLVGNGISSCYEEKMLMHSDRIVTDEQGLAVPKSVFVIEENMRFFKVTNDMEIEPLVSFAVPPNAVDFRKRRLEKVDKGRKRKKDDREGREDETFGNHGQYKRSKRNA